MTPDSFNEMRRERQARTRRVAHPLHERLIPNLEGAPEPVCVAQLEAERLIKHRRDLASKTRTAEEAARTAPKRDIADGKAALAAGKTPPPTTVATAEAEAVELRRQYNIATEAESDALNLLARVIAEHGDEWAATLDERLRSQAEAAAEKASEALEAWGKLDADYTLAHWLHKLDPATPGPVANTTGLRIGDVDPGKLLAGIARLAKEAPRRAVEGESGRQVRAELRAATVARRRQRAEKAGIAA